VLAGALTAFVDDFAEERLSVRWVAAGFDTDLLVVVVVDERLFAELCGAELSVDVLTVSLCVERLVVPAFCSGAPFDVPVVVLLVLLLLFVLLFTCVASVDRLFCEGYIFANSASPSLLDSGRE